MTNQFEFNANDVKCNGNIGGAALILNKENNAKLTTFINTHFMLTDKKALLEELDDSGMINQPWYIGSRASSTEHLVHRIASGLVTYGLIKFGQLGGTYKAQREMAEMWTNAQVNKMTAGEIITILEKALIDCATADHYYSFEKMW